MKDTQIPPYVLHLLRASIQQMEKGLRVEWLMDKDGTIKANTVQRKTIK